MKKKDFKEDAFIKIDYDDIDVVDIMKQIKKKAAQEQGGPLEEEPLKGLPVIKPSKFQGESATYGGASGMKTKVKMVLLKIMRPFTPLIKLLVLPVHEEIIETAQNLHQTNLRLDALSERTINYTKMLHSLCHNLVIELTKLKIEEENLKTKTRIMEKDFEFLGKREKALEKLILK